MMRSVPARLLALVFVLGACAPAARNTGAALPPPPPPPAAEAEPTASGAEAPAVNPATRLSEPPETWQLLDATEDGVPGTGVRRAERELLAGREPARTVVVAVIDGGIDTAHVDLRANLWRNEDETPGNGVDDDGNGFVDDVYGWNFIGGEDGRNVHRDTYEVTRLHVLCTAGSPPSDPYLTAERCSEVAAEFEQERAEAAQTYQQIRSVAEVMEPALVLLRQALGTDSLTVARVNVLRPTTPDVERAKRIYLQLAAQGATPEVVRDALKAFESRAEYGFQPSFDPRDIVGDDYADTDEHVYGNPDVTGPDASHGTHVAGIIGAVRDNGVGIDGVAPAVRLMAVRAVPDGDERDKDVANAIRYAVDNGAHIINMSFGKGWSPRKAVVDEAVRYAEQHGVLLVHAAGNDGEDVDVENNYPSPILADGSRAGLWIEVGATTWKGADSLVAEFSNYGRTRVDVFAPGYDILSATPGGGFQRQSGTSMAAPVVSGLAALLMAYHPDLTAADVKRILLESATRFPQAQVLRPGSDSRPRVPFESLSATGGIVNAYEAIRMAQRLTSDR